MAKETFVKPIHLACSSDELRPILCCVKILNGYAIASNGYVIVKQKLRETTLMSEETIEKVEGKLIGRGVWAELVGATSLEIEDDKIIAVTDAGKVIFEFTPEQTLFPNVDTIIDAHTVVATDKIAFDSKWIHTLSKIFATTRLRFDLCGSSKGALVTPIDTPSEFAYVMPIGLE